MFLITLTKLGMNMFSFPKWSLLPLQWALKSFDAVQAMWPHFEKKLELSV